MAQSPVDTIYIGYTFMQTDRKKTEGFIIQKFGEILGDEKAILRVDIVKKRDEKASRDYISVYVHIAFWPKNSGSKKLQTKLSIDKPLKIKYSDKFYWKCLRSNREMPTEEKKFGKAYIEDSDSDSGSDSD
jgi:hypothetical protein